MIGEFPSLNEPMRKFPYPMRKNTFLGAKSKNGFLILGGSGPKLAHYA